VSKRPPPPRQIGDPDPDRPKKSARGGRVQPKRGKRAVDQLIAGSGQGLEVMPPGFLRGRAPDAKVAPFSETLGREQVRIPEVIQTEDGQEVELELTVNQREMLGMVLAGATTAAIAERFGMTVPSVRNILSGRRSAHVREAYRLLLEASGINAPRLVAKTLELLSAQRAQWNPDTKSWDKFPDYSTQLGTWRVLIQLLGFMPARAQAAAGTGPAVVINHNLGAEGQAPPQEGTFVINVGAGGRARVEGENDVLDVEAEQP
jgi:DNA-binding CsgD family transcriptional regulator